MKKILLALILVISVTKINAQVDTTKIEQYCKIVATSKMFSKKVTIDIDFGEFRPLFSTNRLRDAEGKLQSFNGVVDALNYMGAAGWILVNAFPIYDGNQTAYNYYFKKSFNKSELNNQVSNKD